MKVATMSPLLGRRAFAVGALALGAAGCGRRGHHDGFAVGYLNNVTHAQALVGATSGRWKAALGQATTFTAFPAGPAVMEALSAGSIDAGFLGASAVVNAFVRSRGRKLRVLAGGASGGASLVVRAGLTVRRPHDLRGRTVTASLIGSMPDVSMRTWLRNGGVRAVDAGGDVRVVPMPNTEAYELLRRGKIDASWAQEPWASRMVAAGATRALDERELWDEGRFPSVVLAVATSALERDGGARAAQLVALLADETRRLSDAGDAGRDEVTAALKRALGKAPAAPVMADAWSRFSLTDDPLASAIGRVASDMRALGYLPTGGIDGLVTRARKDRDA